MPSDRVMFLPIEVGVREFDSKILLAAEAVARGWAVVLGHKFDVSRQAVSFGAGGVYLGKGVLRPGVDSLYRALRESGAKILGQNEEAGLQHPSFEDFFSESPSMREVGSLDAYLCWGEEDHHFLNDFVNQAQYASKGQIPLTGSPRASLWGPLGETFYTAETARYQEKFGDYLLFATSFASGNYVGNDSGYFRFMRDRHLFPTFSESTHRRLAIRDLSNLSVFTQAILSLIELTDFSIVIRPHPEEDVRFWRNFARHDARIFVQSEGDVFPLILGSTAVIHNSSTVSVQAFRNVPYIIELGKTDSGSGQVSLPTLLSRKANDARDILEILSSPTRLTSSVPSELLRRVDGRGAPENVRRIMDLVESLGADSDRALEISFRQAGSSVLRGLAQNLMRNIPKNFVPTEVVISRKKRPTQKLKIVRDKLGRAGLALGRELNYSIRSYGGRLFVIKPKRD